MLIFFLSFELPDFKAFLFSLSRISESNHGLSSGRTVASLLGTLFNKIEKSICDFFSQASLMDPSYKRSQLWFTTGCLS